MGTTKICGFCMKNSDFWIRITCLCGSQTSPKVFRIQNRDFSTRIASLHGSQPSSVFFAFKTGLSDQNYKSLCVPDLTYHFVHAKQRDYHQNYDSLWVKTLICGLCMQNSDFRTRITSLSGSQTSPIVFGIQNSDFSTRIASLYWSKPSSVVFAFKTATLTPELEVSMGPSPHLWFLHAKKRLLDQNYKPLRVPQLTCRFVHAKQRD